MGSREVVDMASGHVNKKNDTCAGGGLVGGYHFNMIIS